MSRLPPWAWLALALLFGVTASFMALNWLKGQSPRQQVQVAKTAPVVVAARDIGTATAMSPELLALRQWPVENRPQGSFAALDDLKNRVAAYPIAAGELILVTKLAPKGAAPGLTALVPPNKRAMTVKVDEASGVAGFLTPDNRVDVVVTIKQGEYRKEPVSKVVLQNLKVLGIGQKIETRPGEKPQVVPTVTLEVTPEEGERLALAAREGHISLALRSQEDQNLTDTRGITTSRLLGMSSGRGEGDASEAPASPSPARPMVEILRGLSRESKSF
jgi:pilus assembly protein CpaB